MILVTDGQNGSGPQADDPDLLEEVLEAKVVAMFPPRPDAIVTLLHSDEFLPGTQTLLYSLKVRCAQETRIEMVLK